MTLQELEQKWRESASAHHNQGDFLDGHATACGECADELEAALERKGGRFMLVCHTNVDNLVVELAEFTKYRPVTIFRDGHLYSLLEKLPTRGVQLCDS